VLGHPFLALGAAAARTGLLRPRDPRLPGYYRLAGQRVPGHVETAVSAFRYRVEVFVAPPWPEIYRNDAERHQDFGEAERTHEALVDAYARGGYHLVDLPLAVPVERLRFVLGRVGLPVDAGPGGGGPRHRR
jgi:predicted ATPase